MKKYLLPKKSPVMNITPLLDVMFVIIIFFSLGTELKNIDGIRIDLPTSTFSNPVGASVPLQVRVDESGAINVNDEIMELKDFDEMLAASIYPKEKAVVLKIDKRLSHGNVVEIIDRLMLHSYRKIQFSTLKSSD